MSIVLSIKGIEICLRTPRGVLRIILSVYLSSISGDGGPVVFASTLWPPVTGSLDLSPVE